MRSVTKTTPPMTPPTIAPVLTWEPPVAIAPVPVEEPLGVEEVDDMLLPVVEADVEVAMEDPLVEPDARLEVELEVDELDRVDVEDPEDIEVAEEDGMGMGRDDVVGRPGDADVTDEDMLELPD